MGLFTKWKDVELPFPQNKNTGAAIRDKLFNGVLSRYKKFNHPWMRSDQMIWNNVIYHIGDLIGIVLFFWIMWLLINFSLKKYGEMKTLFYIAIIIIFRINVLIQQISALNKKF